VIKLATAKRPPDQELEAFRAALETSTFLDAALAARVTKFCAEKGPLDAANTEACKARLTEALDLAKVACAPPPGAAAAAAAPSATLDRNGTKALKKIELTVRRLRDDWGEHLGNQLEEIMQMIPEAIKEMGVQETEEKGTGQIQHGFFEEELALYARFIESTNEAWCGAIEEAVNGQLEGELTEHLVVLEESAGALILPQISLSLRSKNWQANAEVKVKAADHMSHLNAGAVGQVGMAMMPLAMLLGPGAVLAKVGLSAATLAVGFFSSKKKKAQEDALQKAKAHEELSKQLVALTRQRMEDTRKTLQRRLQVFFQEIIDALAEYKEDHSASPMTMMPARPQQNGLSQVHQLMLRSRWVPALEGYLQSLTQG